MAAPESIPPDLFLDGYPPEIRDLAERLRDVVHEAVPVRKVRFVTYEPGDTIPTDALLRYTSEAAALGAGRGSVSGYSISDITADTRDTFPTEARIHPPGRAVVVGPPSVS